MAEISTPASEIPIAVEVPPTEQGNPKIHSSGHEHDDTSVDTKEFRDRERACDEKRDAVDAAVWALAARAA